MKKSFQACLLPFFIVLLGHCAESTGPMDLHTEEPPVTENLDPVLDQEPASETIDIHIPDFTDPSDSIDLPADEVTATSPIGGPCRTAEDCDVPESITPFCLTDVVIFQFPGGYCTGQCPGEGSCGPDAECVDLSFVRYCIRKCSTAGECRIDEGYLCDIIPYIDDPNTYCIPNV